MIPLIGLVVFCALAWLISEDRRRFPWRLALSALALQLTMGFVLTRVPGIRDFFFLFNHVVTAVDEATRTGSAFMFGYLGGGPLPFAETSPGTSFIVAFRVLPVVLVTSALSALLFHWGVLQKVIGAIAWVLRKSLGGDPVMIFGVAANVFLGVIETPLLILPYLRTMSRSSLFTVLTAGLATVAGTVMVLYATVLKDVVPEAAGQILIASLLSAPAALLMGQIIIPAGREDSGPVDLRIPSPARSALEALITGTLDGIQMVLNIAGVIIVLFALMALVNTVLGLVPTGGAEPVTVAWLSGWLFAPLCWLMGIPWSEAVTAGRLMGIKTFLNEFVAYSQMAEMSEATLSPRSKLIMTYALCGFANFGSLGILIGGLGTVLKDRKDEVVALSVKSLVAGTLATLLTGAVISLVG